MSSGGSQIRKSAPRFAKVSLQLVFYNVTQVVRISEKLSFGEKTRFIVPGLSTSNLR